MYFPLNDVYKNFQVFQFNCKAVGHMHFQFGRQRQIVLQVLMRTLINCKCIHVVPTSLPMLALPVLYKLCECDKNLSVVLMSISPVTGYVFVCLLCVRRSLTHLSSEQTIPEDKCFDLTFLCPSSHFYCPFTQLFAFISHNGHIYVRNLS